jgi:EAL domain-containing protein (putative c-di-GMP-specific phosphodiesterase class I)/ActR/RegA family two-component response regulator
MTTTQSILVIDDDFEAGQFVVDVAGAMGMRCVATTDPQVFIESLRPEVSLVILDLMIPQVDGIELLRMLGDRGSRAGIILMSGIGKRVLEAAEELATALGLNLVGHLQKPFRLTELEAMLQVGFTGVTVEHPARGMPSPIPDDELRVAVECEEFVMHYQPQVAIATGEVIGVEALVRWQHPKRGLIFPDAFIGRCESLGLIDKLGWNVLQRALGEIGSFANAEGNTPLLSVNISTFSLHDLHFPDTLADLVARCHVKANSLTLEVTESGLVNELSHALDVLTRLRMKGFSLSIDDFGTGYSMLQQLRLIPANELKIDKSFVLNMHLNRSDSVLVQKTIEIGHDLGMTVVAEGVETPEQLAFLWEYGCDVAQGYFFTRPLAAAGMVDWLAKFRSSSHQVFH